MMMINPKIRVPSWPTARNIMPRDIITVATATMAPRGRMMGSKPFTSVSPYRLHILVIHPMMTPEYRQTFYPIPTADTTGCRRPYKLNAGCAVEASLHSPESGRPDGLDRCLGSIAGIQLRDDDPDMLLGGYFRR